jgi:3-oxoacyl-[acyl-carrier protein] reductase
LLARHGATVYVADFRASHDNDAAFAELGIVRKQCDVRLERDLETLFDAVVAQSGRVDILVNNAGIGMTKQIEDVTEEDWHACIDTNLKGAFFGAKHAIRHMRPLGGGVIVNMSSNAGLLPRAHDPVYSISKLALVGLTKSLALCHARDRIRVNAVCPGPVSDTGMVNDDLARAEDPEAMAQQVIAASPLAKAWDRMITPEEVAQAVLYLVGEAAAMVTGTALGIDGGKSLGVPP